jgi:hypothetical protein
MAIWGDVKGLDLAWFAPCEMPALTSSRRTAVARV